MSVYVIATRSDSVNVNVNVKIMKIANNSPTQQSIQQQSSIHI